MIKEELKQLFQNKFDYNKYSRLVLHDLLGCNNVSTKPELLSDPDDDDKVYYIGERPDANGQLRIGFFYTEVKQSDVTRRRVGLRKLIDPYVKYDLDAAISVFDDGRHWRLSLVSDLKFSAKRYSYVMGDADGQYRTPVERLSSLRKETLTVDDLVKTFSVEALSDDFFNEYKKHYEDIVAHISGKRMVKNGNRWEEQQTQQPDAVAYQAFQHLPDADKAVRDYVKKMLGRIVFLHFIQKKEWLCGDKNFLQHTFEHCDSKNDFLESVLEPLFFGILNTDNAKRAEVFRDNGWQARQVDEWATIPYLNGGLFERDEADNVRVQLPQEIFQSLFDFFASYNFTVDENDPDDAEIGVDPEMLGKIFENLLEDNKEKGAFYTPKEIVRYMCKESLIAYLESKTPDVGEAVLREFVELHEMPAELEAHKKAVGKALREVRICDPAIGSGAFPMGLLGELWRCRKALGDSTPLDELKKEIIQNNIYGVDIEQGAIDIARLRFWLSIVVDAQKAEPLPNFDYKFMQGNSLIESFEGTDLSHMLSESRGGRGKKVAANQYGMDFSTKETKQNLQLLLRQYFSITDHKEKDLYRHQIDETVKAYIHHQGLTPDASSRLDTLCTYANQDFFLWHTWFKEVFDNGGFDIVIGNPPYIQLQSDGGRLGSLYQDCGFETFARTGDIYSLFYEQGWRVLTAGGHLCFITSNKWMRAGYGELTRRFFADKTNPRVLIDLGANIFKNATVDTNILLFSRSSNKGCTTCAVLNGNICNEKLSDFVKQQHSVCSFSTSDSWVILSPIEQSIKRKIESVGTPLKDWDIQIYRGVLTGCNEAFIVTTEKRNEILANCLSDDERKRTEELIRPILRGRDIKRYSYDWADLWLIATFPSRHYDIDKYPAVKDYLLSIGVERLEQTGKTHIVNGEKIKSRKKTNNKWFETQDSISYWDDFNKPRIVYGQFQDGAEYSFAEGGIFLSSNEYMLISKSYSPKCLLAFLNCKALEWMLAQITGNLGGNAKIGQKSNFLKLPVPSLHIKDQKQYDALVTVIIEKRQKKIETNEIEKQIDREVYKLYGLSEEEIQFIESQ